MILLDARNITDRPAGVARYAMALIPRLAALAPYERFVVIRHSSNRQPLFAAPNVEQVWLDRPNDGVANFTVGGRDLKRIAERHGTPDRFHSLFHIVPRDLPPTWRVSMTLHDFIWIDHPGASQPTALGAASIAAFASVAIPHGLRRSDVVISVSQATAQRAQQWIPGDKLRVVHHGVEPRYFESPPEPDEIVTWLRAEGARYVVAVGNDKPYKNLQTLVRAFARVRGVRPGLRLVLVGACEGLRPLVAELGVERDVVFLGFLDDEDLRRVLGHADLFVFPSLVEGFGLPPIEAMALGVPTIVSDIEPMTSVAADAAMRFEPTDVGALAELLESTLANDAIRANLREIGRRHAVSFDWDVTARRTLNILS